jgi:uncharacterized protein
MIFSLMEKLFEMQSLLLKQLSTQLIYQRRIFKTYRFDNQLNCIVGARGVGKTTFLLDYVSKHGGLKQEALYVSADNMYFLKETLVDLIDRLYKETDVRLLCIDEIHKQPNWQQQLKNIADLYFDFKIIFTGSSQIDLIHSQFDLSRRVTTYYLHGLSFREYLEIQYQTSFPCLTLDVLIKEHPTIAASLNQTTMIKDFHRYLRVGYYPFFKLFTDDAEKYQVVQNIVQKVIYEDIALFHTLKTGTLMTIENLYKFVLSSAPGEVNAYKLSSNLQKDFDSVSNYLMYLKQAGLIRFLYSGKSGQAYLRNPVKMYPDNTNILFAAFMNIADDNLLGKARETFVINQFQNAGLEVYFSREGDFESKPYVFEVGGKNKTAQQLGAIENSYVLADGIFCGIGRKIPLYLFGFLS